MLFRSIKVCFALVVGYVAFAVEKLAAVVKAKKREQSGDACASEHADAREHEHGREREHADAHGHDAASDGCAHIRGCHRHSIEGEQTAVGENATRRQKAARVFREYIEHPLVHTATVILFIFVVNVVFGVLVYYVGEQRIADFIKSTGYLQPLVAALVGLIPNCAASVVITELYVVGGLNLGGAVAGLCMGAGIGYAVLVKQNRPIKNTVAVIIIMYALSALLGVCVTACGY